MKNETYTNNPTTEKTAGTSMSGKQRLLSGGLVFACIIMALLLAAFIAVSAVILEPHIYKKAARNEVYLAGVESAAVDIMKDAARENGLSKTMLMKHVQSDAIRKLAQRNAADAALVLKGSQVIYGHSFDQAALQLDIYKYYEQRLPDPEAATAPDTASGDPGAPGAQQGSAAAPAPDAQQSTATAPAPDAQQGSAAAPAPDAQQSTATAGETIPSIQAQDTAPLLWNPEEDPEREALREQADEMAAEIAARIDTAVRVIDMEQVVYDYSDGYLLDWLRFMGRGGVLLPLALLGLLLLLLYRLTWQRGFAPWLAGMSFCSGVILLACAAAIPAMGLLDPSVEPVQLAILYETMTRGLLAELLVMSILWFIVGYIALRAAIGRPVSTRWLKALLARLRPAAEAAGASAPATPETPGSTDAPAATAPETPGSTDAPAATASEIPDTGDPAATAPENPGSTDAPAATAPEIPDTGDPETPESTVAPAATAPEIPDTGDPETPDVPTDPLKSPIGDIASGSDSASDNRSAPNTPTHADLLATIKKAAADSTNSLLGRKRR